MTISEINTEITNKLKDLEGDYDFKSKKVYDERMKILNEAKEIINRELKEYKTLLDLKTRIDNSITVMQLAESCGLITEP